jgi:sugar O-acyltransferase (sialic acid O-acetyltransferase NeuD family)
MKHIAILGAGGFAKEVYSILSPEHKWTENKTVFLEDPQWYHKRTIFGSRVVLPKEISPDKYELVFGIGDPNARQEMYQRYSGDYCFVSVKAYGVRDWLRCEIGAGAIICPGSIITVETTIGKGLILNLNATVGHNCRIGDWVTVSPGAHISGSVSIGDRCYIGTGAVIREGISICSDVVIGSGAVVVKNIYEPGTYVGCPAKRIK